jgi:hypothetical protein
MGKLNNPAQQGYNTPQRARGIVSAACCGVHTRDRRYYHNIGGLSKSDIEEGPNKSLNELICLAPMFFICYPVQLDPR